MKKLQQDGHPGRVWIQTWTGGEEQEPIPFEVDDWSGGLFNHYILSSFTTDSEGVADTGNSHYTELSGLLDGYFRNDEVSPLHRMLTGTWARESGMAGDDTAWFTFSWDEFEHEAYRGKALAFAFIREKTFFLSAEGSDAVLMRGLPMQKPAFAALIFPGDTEGYRLFLLEPQPTVWSMRLFPFKRKDEDPFHAKEFFRLCTSFSKDVMEKEKQLPRSEQIDFLADSLSYADRHKSVQMEEFKQEVLRDPAIIDAFENYQEKYAGDRNWNPPDRFAVSDQVQNQARKFVRSIIKLDKNFHIYVHGNKERIEKGFDEERKLHYYRLWFDSEA
jgi:hypothetical protein